MTNFWVLIAVAGYLTMAVSQLIDKALLNIAFKEAKSFVFLIGALNIFALVLLPFGVSWVSWPFFAWACIAGALFIFALIPFLSSLQGDDASRVIPLVGGLVPLFSFLGEWLLFNARFSAQQQIAFTLLVAGSVVLTFTRAPEKKRSWLSIIKAVFASFLFAASFLLTDYVFSQTSFINGFFWMRAGSFGAALFLLASAQVRKGIVEFFTKHGLGIKSAYFGTQALNGAGFVMQNYAISLANVSLVNALQGSQYLFILIVVALASRFKPGILNERITVWLFLEKLTAVFLIIGGIALLTL